MLQNDNFLICSQLARHPLTELFHLSDLFQMPNDRRKVDVEFFSNFSCSLRASVSMVALNGPCQLLMAGRWVPHL